ncbi:replication protein A 70 kDa DNA-binding subunit B [Tanacetum coccineum]
MCVQNGYHGTKLFVFDGSVPIVKEEFSDVKEYSIWLFARHDIEKYENTSIRISTASKNSTKESFVSKIPPRIIAELLDVAYGVTSIIVGTIIAIHEEEGWWYISCKGCKKKVIRSSDMVDLEADVLKKTSFGKDNWFCLQIRVQDESGTMSLTLRNDEVQAVVDRCAYQLCDKYEKSEHKHMFPTEITALVGKKYAFKVSINDYNVKKMLPIFTVLRLSGDPEIIESIRPLATPTKDTEATSSVVLSVTLLDLKSRTDDNTTPVNTVNSIATTSGDKDPKNKHPTEDDIGSDSSNGKKRMLKSRSRKMPERICSQTLPFGIHF